MKAKLAPLFLLAGVTLLLAQDNPAQHKIEQKGREFSVKEIVVRPGERIEFCNADEVTHNVFSKSASNAFNIKTQMPGNSSVVEFKDEGSTEVRCAIHPTMKLVVHVRK